MALFKLQAAGEIVHSPDRLKKPLIREEGSVRGKFREASWDEALDLVAGKFRHFKDQYGPQSVCWLRGMAADWGAPWDYANRLMNAFGSPNSVGNGSVCHVARDMAHVYTYGAMTMPQIKASRCILVWGKSDPDTNPAATEAILAARKQGAKLIVVDPIRTKLASLADIWLQVKPGHDGPLAMAMIREIIAAGLHDADFVREWTVGFAELRKAAEPFADSEDRGGYLARPRRHHGGRPPVCHDQTRLHHRRERPRHAAQHLSGYPGGLHPQGADRQCRRAGRRLHPPAGSRAQHPAQGAAPRDVPPVTRDYPLFNTFHPTWGLNAQSCVIDAILDEAPYAVRMLVVQSGNPAVTMTDSNRVRKALEKLEFLVVLDPFMTRTAEFAHVVLPAASCFEKTQLNRSSLRNNLVMLQDQVMDWQGESWPDWKIIFELGRRLGLERDFPWQTAEEAIDYQLEPSGITVAKLRENPMGIEASKTAYRKVSDRWIHNPLRQGRDRLRAAARAGPGGRPLSQRMAGQPHQLCGPEP